MWEYVTTGGAIFGITSIKHILFGVGHFDPTIFHFVQFVMINLLLLVKGKGLIELINSVSLWALFGLSPHDETDYALGYFLDDNQSPVTNTTNHPTRRLEDGIEPEKQAQSIVEWVDEYKFMLSIMSLVAVIFVSFTLNCVHTVVKRGACRCDRSKVSKVTPGMRSIINRYRTSGYTNFFVKIMLVVYCNMCSITNAQLTRLMDAGLAVGFWAVCFACLEIAFPFYIIRLLNDNSARLSSPEFKKKYGALYENFNDSPKDNKFIIIILIKQYIYGILINISHTLTVLQNSLILGANAMFLLIHICHSPYKEGLYYVQALMMCVSTVTISAINYVFIIDGIDEKWVNLFTLISTVVHVITFGSFFIIQVARFCKKRAALKYDNHMNSNQHIEMPMQNPLNGSQYFLNTDTERKERMSDILSKTQSGRLSTVGPSIPDSKPVIVTVG